MANEQIKLSVVLPCRDEEDSIGICIEKINSIFKKNNINGEIIVSDSSKDNSPKISSSLGAIVIKHDKKGYGVAYLEGFKRAQGKYIFMADPDNTYDFNEIPKFLKCLEEGYDFIIGNRFGGMISKGSMPWSHRYIGNPILSSLFRLFFNSKITDVHCGMRAIRKEALDNLMLKTTGMEFASEMVIRAVKNKIKIKELPINYHNRKGQSKLNTLSDGWRHLRFMLLYSPLFLFFIPGLILFTLGIIILTLVYFNILIIGNIQFDYHPMFIASLFTIIGYQLIIFSLFAKTYAITHLGEKNLTIDRAHKYLTIEKASLTGLLIIFIGFIIYLSIFIKWFNSGFGPLEEIKESLIALTLIVIGIQTISSSFILSILGIKEK